MKKRVSNKTKKHNRRMGAVMMAGGLGWGGLATDDAMSHLSKGIKHTPFRGKLKAGLALATIPGSAYLAYKGYKKFRSKK